VKLSLIGSADTASQSIIQHGLQAGYQIVAHDDHFLHVRNRSKCISVDGNSMGMSTLNKIVKQGDAVLYNIANVTAKIDEVKAMITLLIATMSTHRVGRLVLFMDADLLLLRDKISETIITDSLWHKSLLSLLSNSTLDWTFIVVGAKFTRSVICQVTDVQHLQDTVLVV